MTKPMKKPTTKPATKAATKAPAATKAAEHQARTRNKPAAAPARKKAAAVVKASAPAPVATPVEAASLAVTMPVPAPVPAPIPSPSSRANIDLASHGLSLREDRFVREYLVDLNGSAAYRRAFPDVRESTARNEAAIMLKKPAVADAVADGSAQLAKGSEISAVETMRRISLIATADTRELMEVRIGSCRYCWGAGHRYHFTPAEYKHAEANHAKMVERDEASGDFDPQGGIGFNRNRLPNSDCPECFGEGSPRTVLKDSRMLSEAGALLFAGVKETKDGFEVKVHSIPDALQQAARRHGLFNDKLNAKVEVDAIGDLREFLANRSSRLPIRQDE